MVILEIAQLAGEVVAEITMNGYCYDGVLNLDLMEVATGETEATMTCDGKDFDYVTYYPPPVRDRTRSL